MARLSTILVPVVVLGGAIAGWTAIWSFGADRAEAVIDNFLAEEVQRGRTLQCGERRRGGYPFRLEITCTRPVIEVREEGQVRRTLRFERLEGVSQIWTPGHVIAEATGPMQVATIGVDNALTITWTKAQASAQLKVGGYDDARVVVDDLTVLRATMTLVRATRSAWFARPNPTDPLSLDVLARLDKALFGERAAEPVDAELQFTARKLFRTAGRPQPLPPREWQAAGGTVEIVLLRAQQGDALAIGRGTLSLTPEGRPDGQVELRFVNAERIMQASGLAAALGPLAMGALQLASRPTEVEGRPGRIMTLNARDGRLQIGPIRLPLPVVIDP